MTQHLLGLMPEQVADILAARGVADPLPDARRLCAHFIAGGARDWQTKKPVRRIAREAAQAAFCVERLEVVERVEDPGDAFVKYLLRSPDGALSEAVRIPLAKQGAYSVCLSSQVGCAMRCDFCATGRLGLSRQLRAWEMVAALLAVRDDLPPQSRITGAVFMGQGEPFHNYDEVIQAAHVLSHPCGGQIDKEAITISTVGLVDKIRRYTAEGHKYRLIVSLHSALPERRRALLPVAGQQPLSSLAEAIRDHARATRDRVTVAWTVLGGINTGTDEVEALRALLGDVPIKLNLIDVNDAREDGYRRASSAEREGFLDALQVLGVPIVRRYSGGGQRHAACGMLAATRHGQGERDEPPAPEDRPGEEVLA